MATSLDKAFEGDVRPFIDIIDELRSLGLDKDVPLPAVVVVGDQSAGKSSVLEAISGVELPRGTDIVTRCPLELRLKNIHKNKVDEGDESEVISPPWKGIISYTDEESNEVIKNNIKNPSSVGAAVENATEKLTEGSKGISDSLIHLEVQSATVPDLTLIDLPGIARVAVEGQSSDVPMMTKQLIKKYVKKQETIVLAVVPCNVDIATTEALQLAQEVDPEGKRTLGVLTKPDLMDQGTEGEVCKIVNGEKVRLELGYTVVKCRGQKAVEDKMSLEEAIESEEEFFKNHVLFNNLYQDKKTGIQNLSHQLTKQLVEQIKTNMPSLKRDIEEKLFWTTIQLENYGEGLPEDDRERQNYLVNLLMKLGELFKKLARADHIEQDAINNLRLFAHVKEIFKKLADDVDILKPQRSDVKLKKEISKEIKKRKGKELPTFLSYPVFEGIVRKQIQKINAPAKECLKNVNLIIEQITSAAIDETLVRFQPLQMEVHKLMNQERKKAEKNANDALATIFAMENLVFTQDWNFARLMEDIEKKDKEEAEIARLSYVSIPPQAPAAFSNPPTFGTSPLSSLQIGGPFSTSPAVASSLRPFSTSQAVKFSPGLFSTSSAVTSSPGRRIRVKRRTRTPSMQGVVSLSGAEIQRGVAPVPARTKLRMYEGTKRRPSDWFRKGEKLDDERMIKCLEAYCEVATTRMVDHIPMAIYYHLVKQLLEGMATEIMKITTEENSHRILLREDASTVSTRKRLLDKQERLEKATMKLLQFGSLHHTANGLYSDENASSEDDEN